MNNYKLAQMDKEQRKPVSLPSRALIIGDGRMLNRIKDYDIRTDPRMRPYMNKQTREGIKDSKGWRHDATSFVVTAGIELTERFGILCHVSMSYPDKDPTWNEIKMIRALFFPKVIDVVMVLPKEDDYINVHTHCFHLWQAPESWNML